VRTDLDQLGDYGVDWLVRIDLVRSGSSQQRFDLIEVLEDQVALLSVLPVVVAQQAWSYTR